MLAQERAPCHTCCSGRRMDAAAAEDEERSSPAAAERVWPAPAMVHPPPLPSMSGARAVELALSTPARAPPSPAAGLPPLTAAEPDEELFEVYDARDMRGSQSIGQAPRAVVHAQGLLHKAVYVWVVNARGELLLQRRSPKKKIGPLLWDLSVAEHLAPGEDFADGASRGMAEELGVHCASLIGPICDTHPRKLVQPPFYDFELVQSFLVQGFGGQVKVNGEEVIDVRYISFTDLEAEMQQGPDRFTEWFRAEWTLVRTKLEGYAQTE